VSVGIVPTYGDKLAFSGTFVLVAGRNSNANNIYLRTEGNVAMVSYKHHLVLLLQHMGMITVSI
jgi:hypothetical protein